MVRNDELDAKLVVLPDRDKSAEEELDVPFVYVTVQARLAHLNRLTTPPGQGRYRLTIADGFAKPKRKNDCQRMQYRTSGHGRRFIRYTSGVERKQRNFDRLILRNREVT